MVGVPKTPPRQLARIQLRNRAHYNAVRKLIELHKEDWDIIYRREASALGISPQQNPHLRKPKS